MFSRHKNKYHMLSKIRHERKCQMQQSRLVFLVILMLSKAFFSFFFLFSSCIGQVRLGQVEQARSCSREIHATCCLVFHSAFEIFKFTRNTLSRIFNVASLYESKKFIHRQINWQIENYSSLLQSILHFFLDYF